MKRDFQLFPSVQKGPLAIPVGIMMGGLILGLAPGWALAPQARQYYIEAQQAELRGNLDGAEHALRKATALDPQDYFNYVKLAGILSQQGKPNEAASLYQQALNLNPQDGMILFSLGSVYEQLGQYRKAEEAYALTLQNNSRYQFALLNLARVQIQQKEYKPAIANYQKFLTAYPDHYEARRHLAKLYLVTRQESAAVKEYDVLKLRYPDRFNEHVDLARALTASNAPDQALQELTEAYAKEGSKADIDEEMGHAHAALGQPDLAIHNYEKAYSLNPKKDDLLLKIASIYQAQKQWAPAAEKYQAYLKPHPQDAATRHALVDVYLDGQKYESALNELALLKQSATTQEETYDIDKDMAYATQMLGDLPKAITMYQSLLANPLGQKDLQLKSNLALAYHKAGQYAQAVPLYREVYYAGSQPQQSPELSREILSKDLAAALLALGDEAYKGKDYETALSRYSEAKLYADKQNFYPELGLANVYYALGMNAQAADFYTQVLQKEPKNLTAQLYQTKLAMASPAPKSGSPAVSENNIATLEALAKQNPTNPEVLLTLAEAYVRMGNTTGTIAVYEKVLALEPNNAPVLMALATQWQKLGNLEQAKQYYLKTEAVDAQNPVLHYNLGIVYNELGLLDQSAAAYKKAMTLEPANLDAQYGLAITLEKQHKYQEAIEAYQAYTQAPQARYLQEAKSRIQILKQAAQSEMGGAGVQVPMTLTKSVPSLNKSQASSQTPSVKQTPKRIEL